MIYAVPASKALKHASGKSYIRYRKPDNMYTKDRTWGKVIVEIQIMKIMNVWKRPIL